MPVAPQHIFSARSCSGIPKIYWPKGSESFFSFRWRPPQVFFTRFLYLFFVYDYLIVSFLVGVRIRPSRICYIIGNVVSIILFIAHPAVFIDFVESQFYNMLLSSDR